VFSLSLLLMASTLSVTPDIVVRGQRITAVKPIQKVECADPLKDWVSSRMKTRSAPMGKGKYRSHSQWYGGYYAYYCSEQEKRAFKLLPQERRDQINEELAIEEQLKLQDERRWAAKLRKAKVEAAKQQRAFEDRDKRNMEAMRREMKSGVYIPAKVKQLEW
jgi:hypothetical protein